MTEDTTSAEQQAQDGQDEPQPEQGRELMLALAEEERAVGGGVVPSGRVTPENWPGGSRVPVMVAVAHLLATPLPEVEDRIEPPDAEMLAHKEAWEEAQKRIEGRVKDARAEVLDALDGVIPFGFADMLRWLEDHEFPSDPDAVRELEEKAHTEARTTLRGSIRLETLLYVARSAEALVNIGRMLGQVVLRATLMRDVFTQNAISRHAMSAGRDGAVGQVINLAVDQWVEQSYAGKVGNVASMIEEMLGHLGGEGDDGMSESEALAAAIRDAEQGGPNNEGVPPS